jgi:hypothetical protein
MREMTGGCLCGQVRYSTNADPAFVVVCHCKNCQKQTGSAFSVLVSIDVSVSNALITFPMNAHGGALEMASTALADALSAEGFVAKAGLDARNTGAIHVMIGPKR